MQYNWETVADATKDKGQCLTVKFLAPRGDPRD